MDTRDFLFDFLTRTRTSLDRLYDHVGELQADDLVREFDGFGIPSIHAQLYHLHASVRYWVGVLEGRMDVDEDREDFPDLAALAEFRDSMHDLVARYLERHDASFLDTPARMTTWGGHEKEIAPAHVLLRLQTHQFHHQGQITAMCRLLGKPVNGLDLPVL